MCGPPDSGELPVGDVEADQVVNLFCVVVFVAACVGLGTRRLVIFGAGLEIVS